MNYELIIRKAVVNDAEAIQGIIKEAFKNYIAKAGITGTVEALEESIENIQNDIESKEVFIAFIDRVPVGTIRVEIFPDNTACISRFGVKSKYQNLGIGNSLISMVDKLLISKGVSRVWLYTASKYADLMRFYYSRGFYVESTSADRGYVRALLIKEYHSSLVRIK